MQGVSFVGQRDPHIEVVKVGSVSPTCSLVAALASLVVGVTAQPVFRGSEIFPSEEFAARRTRVMAQIGDGVAIVLGATEPPDYRAGLQVLPVGCDARLSGQRPAHGYENLSGFVPIEIAEIEKLMAQR